MKDARDLDDRAAQLAARFSAAGVQTDPGLLGGVVIYASGEQAALFLAVAEHQNDETASANPRPLRQPVLDALAEPHAGPPGLALGQLTRRLRRDGQPDLANSDVSRELRALQRENLVTSGITPGGLPLDIGELRWNLVTPEDDPGVAARGHRLEMPCAAHYPQWRRTCPNCREIPPDGLAQEAGQ